MEIIQVQVKKEDVLNEDPERFLGQNRYGIQLMGRTGKVSKNQAFGGIIVWIAGNSFTFKWDKEKKIWF